MVCCARYEQSRATLCFIPGQDIYALVGLSSGLEGGLGQVIASRMELHWTPTKNGLPIAECSLRSSDFAMCSSAGEGNRVCTLAKAIGSGVYEHGPRG